MEETDAQPLPAPDEGAEKEESGMDVSPPHHPVHNWRDALTHLGIVTAGLFIALMLDGVVQWIHHKQIVHEARRNIRQEIEQNRRIVRKDLSYLRTNLAQVRANIDTLQQIRAGRFQHGSIANKMDFESFNEAAWQTARDTGALSYMPYDEAKNYSGLYTVIDYVNARALGLADREFDAMAPALMGYDIKNLPAEELATMMRGNAQAKIGLVVLAQRLIQLDRELAEAKGESQKR